MKLKRRVSRGKPLEELVKGSLDYTLRIIRNAFDRQFNNPEAAPPTGRYAWIEEVFGDHLIARSSDLTAPDEYYFVRYRRDGESYVFTPRAEWQVVELGYRPKTAVVESQRLVESLDHSVELLPVDESAGTGRRRIRAVGITADVINGNGRRYPAPVLREAVEELRTHLHESAGQGRFLQLLGEAEHPSDKASRRPSILETVVKWEAVEFDGRQVLLEGAILPTSKGNDILALLEGGVQIPVSQRGYGRSKLVKEDGRKVEEVVELRITGYDLVAEASDPVASVTMLESASNRDAEEGEEMYEDLDLDLLRAKYPKLVEQLLTEHDEQKAQKLHVELLEKQNDLLRKEREEREKARERELEEAKAKARAEAEARATELQKQLEEREARLAKLEGEAARRLTEAYIDEETAKVKYPEALKKRFVEAVKKAAPASIEAAKAIIEAKREEYDALMADLQLASKGFGSARVTGPVIEQETGTPEFARAAFEITESLIRAGRAQRRDFAKPQTVNEGFAAAYLERFDSQYRRQLQAEAQMFEEAEQTSDLNLPYSVARAIVAEAVPNLVAASVFDFGTTDQSPSRIYFEKYAAESGATGTVTDESVTSDESAWVDLANKRLKPGTVVVTSDPAGTTYVEGTDYAIDYGDGKLYTLDTGSIGDATAILVDYQYDAVRKGENTAIERAKTQLTFKTLEIAADRLATEITREAVVFSRSQLGWDAVTRTIANLIEQVQRKIDQHVFYEALAAVLTVASNSGGTWTSATDTLDALVEKIGTAKVKVANRYYRPDAVVMSLTNSDTLGNWDKFTAAGSRDDAALRATGYVGRVKGLPVFETTNFSDSWILVVNRELVMHRVFQAMRILGPFPSYSNNKLVAADQYYVEEFNGTDSPVPEKGSYVKVA